MRRAKARSQEIESVVVEIAERSPASAQKLNDSSSAIMITGGPPEEIFIACPMVSLPPSEAAQACRASIEGKWTSAMR
jgi:hypothetical protein